MVRAGADLSRYRLTSGQLEPDAKDPRTLGHGPCSATTGLPHVIPESYQANQLAVWKRCSRCGVRWVYHPHQNHTGRYRSAGPSPGLINRAFTLGAGIPAGQWTAKLFDGYLKLADGERRTGRVVHPGTAPPMAGTGRGMQGPPGPQPDRDGEKEAAQA